MGILRFFLALSVISSHAGAIVPFYLNGNPFIINLLTGRQAVLLFYIISGFYMSLILDKKYVGENRLKAFYINRYLRLFPTYIFIFLLAGIFTGRFQDIYLIIKDLSIFKQVFIWLSNVFIFGTDIFYFISVQDSSFIYQPFVLYPQHNGIDMLVIPPAFSISIELMFYIVCPLFVNNLRRILWVIIFAILYFLFINSIGRNNIIWEYHAFPPNLLFFAIGALAYYISTNFKSLDSRTSSSILFVVMSIFLCIPFLVDNILIITFAFSIPFVFNITRKNKLDMFIGELSYPIYLLHFPIMQIFYNNNYPHNKIGLYTTLISVSIAIAINICIEKPINKFREKITNKLIVKTHT